VSKWLTDHESFLKRGDGCKLNMSWTDSVGPPSATQNVAMFMIAPGDDQEEISALIHDSSSGLDLRVGARYIRGGEIEMLEIALAFEGKPEDVFNGVAAAQTYSLKGRKRKSLILVRTTQIGDLRYRYVLSCMDGKAFMSSFSLSLRQRSQRAPRQVGRVQGLRLMNPAYN